MIHLEDEVNVKEHDIKGYKMKIQELSKVLVPRNLVKPVYPLMTP